MAIVYSASFLSLIILNIAAAYVHKLIIGNRIITVWVVSLVASVSAILYYCLLVIPKFGTNPYY